MKLSSIFARQSLNDYQAGDILVLFGELFQRGYANGLVEAAQRRGMTVLRSTVGRRDEHHQLRPLTEEESQFFEKPWINLPLECGFDLEPNSLGQTPVDLCKPISLKEGVSAKLDLAAIEDSRRKGNARFRHQVQAWSQELEKHLLPGRKVLIAHLMAGGVPRSKIILSLMNRLFKGTGDRHLASSEFWNSDLGQFCQWSFQDVTAESFNTLIEETAWLRQQQEKRDGFIHYSAYGYHGTQIYFSGKLQWFTYTPYLQGFAKKKLEELATHHQTQGILCTVYNCPEILTNSSGIFPGVEIFLYPLLFEMYRRPQLRREFAPFLKKIDQMLVPNGLVEMEALITEYFRHPLFTKTLDFQTWPQHATKDFMELMLKVSEKIIALHKNPNELITFPLSELVIKASGELILQDSYQPTQPVAWIGHDSVLDWLAVKENFEP